MSYRMSMYVVVLMNVYISFNSPAKKYCGAVKYASGFTNPLQVL
jgi:hypothetical protein